MEKFNRSRRDREDDPAPSQPFKIPRAEIPEGLQQARKAALERLASQENAMCTSGPSTSHKTVHPKPPLAVKPSEHDPKPSRLNPVAQHSGVHLQATSRENYRKTNCSEFPTKTCDPAKEDPKPLHPKPEENKFSSSSPSGKEENTLGANPKSDLASWKSEAKPAFGKATEIKENLRSAEQKNAPSPLFKKPSFDIKVSSNTDTSKKCGPLQSRQSSPRTYTYSLQKEKEMGENNSAAEAARSHLPKITLKPAGHSRSILFQGTSKNVKKDTEERGMSVTKTTFAKKVIQEGSGSSPKFHKINTVLGAGKTSDESQEKEGGDGSSSSVRQRVFITPVKMPMSPPKPNRPPRVELQGYKKNIPKKKSENEGLKLTAPSPALVPLISHPPLQAMAAPSLPPRNIKPSSETRNPENDENYDDVEFVSQGHGSTQGGQEGDVEMYEDISDIRSRGKEKKQKKEDKRRMEQEKREQKEKEKKEFELRKKFKLIGPIEVLHQARACVDYKGGKNELTVKRGDEIEIIRLTDNPEGKWLGRIGECWGYIKTTVVEIDYDSLKRKKQTPTGADAKFSECDMEVYDDVGEQENLMSMSSDNSGAGSMLPPPPPSPLNQDIYDEIDDGESTSSTSSSIKPPGKDCGEDVYDDVASSDFSPLLLPDVITWKKASFGKRKSDEKDVRQHKMMDREEIEFRKKFQFVGEIRVLFSTTTIQNLPKRKWGSKELHIRPGESLDVIESTDDTKVLCRNEDGKYGYVLRSNLVQNDGEIYDKVGEEIDYVYDND